MTIRKVANPAFKTYERVITDYDFSGLLVTVEHMPLPEDVIYIPSPPEMGALSDAKELGRGVYGQMPIQIGCCDGHSKKLNVVEYYRDSETDIAVDDLTLILGGQQDTEEDHTYDTSRMEAFLVPAGTAVGVHAATLHYAPCRAGDEGFRCIIALPKGTNLDMESVDVKDPEDRFLLAKDKRLMSRIGGGSPGGAFIGPKRESPSV